MSSSVKVNPNAAFDSVSWNQAIPANVNARKTLQDQITKVLDNSRGNSADSLNKAVSEFRQAFPKLSLWERFKDIFGMSDSAANIRTMATLCIAATFRECVNNSEIASYNKNECFTSLCDALKNAHLIESYVPDVETLVACTISQLLTREPKTGGSIEQTKASWRIEPGIAGERGKLCLNGKIEINDLPQVFDFLKDLEYRVSIDSPDALENHIQQALSGGNDYATVFTTLYQRLPGKDRIALREQLYESGGDWTQLFSGNGLLHGEKAENTGLVEEMRFTSPALRHGEKADLPPVKNTGLVEEMHFTSPALRTGRRTG